MFDLPTKRCRRSARTEGVNGRIARIRAAQEAPVPEDAPVVVVLHENHGMDEQQLEALQTIAEAAVAEDRRRPDAVSA